MHHRASAGTAPALAAVLILLIAGCGSGGTPATSSPSPVPPSALDCQDEAYPCAFSEVADAVRIETDRLASEAARRIEEGATNDEVVAWLDSEPLVAEVEGDADSIRFRPTGGRPVWVTRQAEATAHREHPAHRYLAQSGTMESVGTRSDGHASVTGPGRAERHALVLSPYRWDFADSDDGAAVAERLRELPEYANGVTYAENATTESTEVNVDDFLGWADMQVIHVVSHGVRICKGGKCRAVVAANALPGGTANLFLSPLRGLELGVQVGPPTRPKFNVLLGADFFRDHYRGGLTDAVVFLNGCSTFGAGATDLADAIRGSGSVVLGWNKTVSTTGAYDAAIGMYKELAGNGRPVGDALKHIGELATDSPTTALLSSTGRAAGGDLRIRDVIDLEDTTSGEPLAAGAAVRIVGEPGDGNPDAVHWRLQVDGIEPVAAASAVVQVTVDGHAAPPVMVATGASEANDSWELSGLLDLGVDISAPHPAQFEATLTLPEGGSSVDSVSAVLVAGSEPTPAIEAPMGGVARGHVTDRTEVVPGVYALAEADLVFTLSPGAGPRYFAYDVTGGALTFSQSGTIPDGSCTHSFGPTEFELDPEWLSGGFSIDTGTTPPTFSGSVIVTGPEIEVQKNCTGEYAYLTGPYHTRASAVFIQVFSDEPLPVVGDQISGASLYGDRTFEISASQ